MLTAPRGTLGSGYVNTGHSKVQPWPCFLVTIPMTLESPSIAMVIRHYHHLDRSFWSQQRRGEPGRQLPKAIAEQEFGTWVSTRIRCAFPVPPVQITTVNLKLLHGYTYNHLHDKSATPISGRTLYHRYFQQQLGEICSMLIWAQCCKLSVKWSRHLVYFAHAQPQSQCWTCKSLSGLVLLERLVQLAELKAR